MTQISGLGSHFRRLWLGYAVLVISLGLTISACFVLIRDIRHHQWERFCAASETVFQRSEHDIGFFLKLLEGVRGLFVQRVPEPDEVSGYFHSIDVYTLEKKSGLEAVGLVWRGTRGNKKRF